MKRYSPERPLDNFFRALAGGKHPGSLVRFFFEWQIVLACEPRPGVFDSNALAKLGHTKRTVQNLESGLQRRLRAVIAHELQTSDGRGFRQMADCIKGHTKPKERDLILATLNANFGPEFVKWIHRVSPKERAPEVAKGLDALNVSKLTTGQICDEIFGAYIDDPITIDPRDARRRFREMGVRKNSRPGRPRKADKK